MKRQLLALVLCAAMLLSGCNGLMDGTYQWEHPHDIQQEGGLSSNISVTDYAELYQALAQMIEAGAEQATITVEGYDQEQLPTDLKTVKLNLMQKHPVATWAVKTIHSDLGTTGGTPAVAIKIDYLHDKAEIQKIIKVEYCEQAKPVIQEVLKSCDAGVVILIENYSGLDVFQLTENFAMEHPEYVIEQPHVTATTYPESGVSRILEIKFSYKTSREVLKNMQNHVLSIFESANLWASTESGAEEKYRRLYAYLTMQDAYSFETSVTPAYSLLRYGVGDNKTFAMVYAAMCRRAGLECLTVPGTNNGESCYWNIILVDDGYRHVDLLRSYAADDFQMLCDEEMTGYVWDYDAYPVCSAPQE